MSGRRRRREGQTAAAGDGDKMTEDRMDVLLALFRTPQFRLGVLGGVALLFGWTWTRKNGRRRKEEEEGKGKAKAEQASSSEGKSVEHGPGAVPGRDESLVAGDPITAIVKHPTASVGSEEVKPRVGILFSRVNLVKPLQLPAVLDHPVVPASDSGEGEKKVRDEAVAEPGGGFALSLYSPQKEVVKEVTEAGRLAPGENGRLDGDLPYEVDDTDEAQDGDRIRSVFPDSLVVRHSEDRSDGREHAEDGGSSEERDIFAVTSQGQGLENEESGVPADSSSENLGDAGLEEDGAGFSGGGKPREVTVVPLIEAGILDHVRDVASEKEDLGIEHDANSGTAGQQVPDLVVEDGVSIEDPDIAEATAGVHEVKHEIEDNGEGFCDGREDDVDGGEVEKEAGDDGKDKSDTDQHAGVAREGRRDIDHSGTDVTEHRIEVDERRRECNEGRGEVEEDVSSPQPAEKDIIAEEPEWQQTQEAALLDGLTDVDIALQGDDSTSLCSTVTDLDLISDGGIYDLPSIQSLQAVDGTASALDVIGSSDEAELDIRDKFVDGFDDSPATNLPTPIADTDEVAQDSVYRPADNNMVNGLTSEKSLDRYNEYLADPKLPPALRSQVMRAKAAVEKFYALKGLTVSGSSTTS